MSSTREPGHDLLIMRDGAVGEARSAMGHTEWHARDERRFLQKLADRLNAAVRAGEAKSLIIRAAAGARCAASGL